MKIGLVGRGTYAHQHIRALSRIKGMEVAGVFSQNTLGTEKFASQYSIQPYKNFQEMLDNLEVEVIDIVTSHDRQPDMARQALKSGKNIIISKPMALDLSQAEELVVLAKTLDKKIAVVYPSRFEKQIIKVKHLVEGGWFGKPELITCRLFWRRTQEYYDSRPWRKSITRAGGGVLIMQAIHMIDIMQWLMGSVDSVSGMTKSVNPTIEVEDLFIGVLRFSNGGMGSITASVFGCLDLPDLVEIHGTGGSLVYKGHRIYVKSKSTRNKWVNRFRTIKCSINSWFPLEIFPGLGFGRFNWPQNLLKEQLEKIISDFKANKASSIDGTEAMKSLEIVLALYKSVRENREISIKHD